MNDLHIDAPPFHNDKQWIQVQTLLRQMIALLIDTDTTTGQVNWSVFAWCFPTTLRRRVMNSPGCMAAQAR